jgi:hypothetical protein
MLKSHNKTILEILGRNPIHPFPARMAPGIALDALGDHSGQLRILDPMAGSGTALAVARSKGHKAIGFDLDPLAVLLAGVWTRTIDAESVTGKAADVLHRARSEFAELSCADAYPANSDDETKEFIRYWFDDYARRQLAALSSSIVRVHGKNTRDALWCGFSRLIITKQAGASLAMDLSHSRPHKKFQRAPIKPFKHFERAVKAIVANCPQSSSELVGPTAIVKQGDARQLTVEDKSIDLVLSSPPYLNAIDYMRCSKFSLVWMGYSIEELRRIRGESVGSEAASKEALDALWVKDLIKQLRLTPKLSNRTHGLLATYVWDMGKAIAEVSRVLKRRGRAVYVVGDSTNNGTFIRNSSVVNTIAQAHGLRLISRHSRALPANRRYLPPPSNCRPAHMDARLRREVVLVFNKP